jgi:hypothetical protein
MRLSSLLVFVDRKGGPTTVNAPDGVATHVAPGAGTIQVHIKPSAAPAFAGTLVAEGLAADGLTWEPLQLLGIINGTPSSVLTNPVGDQSFIIPMEGYQAVQLRAPTLTAGSVQVWFEATGTFPWMTALAKMATSSTTLSNILTAVTGVATAARQDLAKAVLDNILTKQGDGSQRAQRVDGGGNVAPAGDAATRAMAMRPSDGAAFYTGTKTGQLPSALGTQTMSGSVGVTIATDDTLMAAIKADVDKIPSKGTAVMTGSTPVTLATDDAAVKALTPSAPSTPAQVTGSGSATALSSLTAVAGVFLQADSTNTANLRIGDSNITTSRGIQLLPGQRLWYPCTNANQVYVIAESGSPKLNYAVR